MLDNLNLWLASRTRAQIQHRSAHERLPARLFLVYGVAAVVIFGLLGYAVATQRPQAAGLISCAAPTALECAFSLDSGTKQILTANLGQQVNYARTVAGWTITVRRVYADANQVVVGYTAAGSDGKRFAGSPWPALGEAEGIPLAAHGRWQWQKAGLMAEVVSFDAGPVAKRKLELGLRFTVPGLRVTTISPLKGSATGSVALTIGTVQSTVTPEPAGGSSLRAGDDLGTGPFSFDLRIPFDPRARTADLHQIASLGGSVFSSTAPPLATNTVLTADGPASGRRPTLERIVITPSETRVYVQGVQLSDGCQAELQVGSWDSTHSSGACSCRMLNAGQAACSFGAALIDQRGMWTVILGQHSSFRFAVP